MKVWVGPRKSGKTDAMLAWMREAPEGEHRVMVCCSREEAMRLLRENRDLESWQFVGPDEPRSAGPWSAVIRGRGGQVVLRFDNLDLWIQRLMRFEVGAVSVTEDAPAPTEIAPAWPPR